MLMKMEFAMKMNKINLIIIICLQFVFRIESQNYNPNLFLKDYSGDMIITTQVKAERNKAILRGTEAKKNRDFVLENYNGIQPSISVSYTHLTLPTN